MSAISSSPVKVDVYKDIKKRLNQGEFNDKTKRIWNAFKMVSILAGMGMIASGTIVTATLVGSPLGIGLIVAGMASIVFGAFALTESAGNASKNDQILGAIQEAVGKENQDLLLWLALELKTQGKDRSKTEFDNTEAHQLTTIVDKKEITLKEIREAANLAHKIYFKPNKEETDLQLLEQWNRKAETLLRNHPLDYLKAYKSS